MMANHSENTEENTFYPIVEHIKDRSLYVYRGGNVFESIVTGKQKEIKEEVAATIFTFCLPLSDLANENPCIMDLLKLGFKQR